MWGLRHQPPQLVLAVSQFLHPQVRIASTSRARLYSKRVCCFNQAQLHARYFAAELLAAPRHRALPVVLRTVLDCVQLG